MPVDSPRHDGQDGWILLYFLVSFRLPTEAYCAPVHGGETHGSETHGGETLLASRTRSPVPNALQGDDFCSGGMSLMSRST